MLFLNPTPAFLATAIDPAVDGSGALFRDHHPGTLPVLEINGFYSQIRPIIQAFVDSGDEQLFVDLMSVMHKYWSSKDSSDTQTTESDRPELRVRRQRRVVGAAARRRGGRRPAAGAGRQRRRAQRDHRQ